VSFASTIPPDQRTRDRKKRQHNAEETCYKLGPIAKNLACVYLRYSNSYHPFRRRKISRNLELLYLTRRGIYEQQALQIVGPTRQIEEQVQHVATLVEPHFDELSVWTQPHCGLERPVKIEVSASTRRCSEKSPLWRRCGGMCNSREGTDGGARKRHDHCGKRKDHENNGRIETDDIVQIEICSCG